MVVSGKTFLEQEQENPAIQLSTGGKNQTVAPSDTINTNKVLEGQKTQTTGTLGKGNWTTRDRIKESITGDQAKRDILNATTTLEEGYKTVQNAVVGAGSYLLNEVSSFLKTGKSVEANKEEADKKLAEIEKQQEKNKKQAETILKEQTVTNKKRENMYTVVDPYKATPQYGPYVDYRQARMNVGSIGEAMKNVTLNNDSTMAYISNGLTTVSKPVINGTDYTKTLQDAYNAITYEYAHNGNLANAELVKKYFPVWKDASDEEINRFINECAYDVEQGKRRDISMYAENFLDLSMPDGYTSKHDAVLQLYGDDEYISYGLGDFIRGTATLDGKSKEDVLNYVKAVKTINHYVDIIKENGANTQGASDFVIAKTFIDDYPGLREAIDIYQNFNLTNKDLATIDAQYTANMEDMKDFAEWKPFTDEERKAYVDQYIADSDEGFFNWLSKAKVTIEGLVPEEYQHWLSVIPGKPMLDWYLGDVYEVDGKFYDKNGNEVPRTEARVGLYNAYVNGLVGFSKSVEDLKVDLDKLAEIPTDSDRYFEASQLPAIDLVNATFRGWMSVDPTGIALSSGLTQFPGVGIYAEQFFETVFGTLGDAGVKLADMIGYTDGWSEESKEKFAEAFSGLVTLPLAKFKQFLWKKAKIKVSNTVIAKSLKTFKEGLKKNIELIEERGEREKINAKNSINKEIGTKEQVKSQEKMVDEMIDQETTNRKSMFIRQAINNAVSDFRKTFLEEYTKETEAQKKANGESTGPTLIDNLFKKAIELGERMKSERAAEIKEEIDNIQKGEAPEVTETKTETPTPEGEQITTEVEVKEPGATVEQTKPATTTKEATGTAKIDEKASQQTKKQIKGILKFIADVLDMGKEIVDFNKRRYRAKKAEKAEREAENRRIIDEEILSDQKNGPGLTDEQIRQMQNNPYSETILNIINALTREITDKKGKIKNVKVKDTMTNDEIQREVLSEGIKKIQEHVDKLVKMRNALKSLYGDLEKNKSVDTSKFPESQPLQKVLKDYGYGIEVEIDPETQQPKATVYKLDGVDANPGEMGEMKYIEDFINKQLRFEKKSEADLQKNRGWLKWNEDTYGKNGRSKALENSFRDAFNKFIEEQGDVRLLRTIDKGFTTLSDALDTLRELLNKDNTVKDNAKNKILKWEDTTINQLNEVIPGIRDLIKLTRVAPEIVKKGIDAKTQTKSTWQKTASVVRYVFVGGAPTLIIPRLFGALGLAAGSALSVIMGSVLFKVSENFGLKMKHKIQGKIPDLDLYNTFVNNLKLDPEVKNSYKAKIKAQIEEETTSAKAKTEKEFNQIIDEVAEILIERKANEIAENKLRNRGTEPEEPATPEEPKGPNTPKGPELTPEEKEVIKQASAIEPKEHSKEAIKLANTIEEIKQTLEDAQTDDASAKLEERGEDVTPESIQKEIDNPKPKTLAEELGLVKEGEFENRTQNINIQEVSTELLQEVRENPEKFGVSEEEFLEIDEELQRRTEQNATAKMKAEDARNTNEDAANMAEIEELGQKKADAKTQEEKDAIQEQIDDKTRKAIDLVQKKRNLESNAEAEEALKEQSNASYNRIEAGKDTSVGKFRQNSYSTLLFAEKYGMKAQKPLSRTSSIENIMENPNPKTKARLLEDKKRNTEEKIKKSKYAKNREKQIAELQKINEAIEENNKNLQALQEKIDTEKELTAKRSKATTREEKKELTKQIDENNKELEKLLDEQQKDLKEMPETEDIEAQEKETLVKHPMKNLSPLDEYGTKEDREGISVRVDNVPDEMGIGAILLRLYKNGEEISTDKAPVAVNKWINRIRDRIIYENDIKEGDIITHNSKGENGEIVGKDIEINMGKQGSKETKAPEVELPTPREASEKFYHASDSDFSIVDMDKTKPEGNGIGFAVNLKEDHPYKDKPYQYEIEGKDFKIGGSETLLSENVLKKICDKLGIEYNEAWTMIELPELSNIIAEESGKGNKVVTKVLVEETGLDGVDTHHDYTVLWNEEKINKAFKKRETKKPETKTEDKPKEEPKEEIGAEPLVKQEDNGKAYAMKGNPTSKEMFERMQYLRNKAKQNGGKISFKDRSELEFLMDRYKTKLEEESKQEYNSTEKQDLDREELGSIGGINVPTYGMSID